jgi:PAS domain S-box-containing protein
MSLLTKILPEAAIRWLNNALRGSSSDRFARVFFASPDWIVITRLSDSLIVEANQGFETMSGYSAREAIGQPISKLNIWTNPEQRAQIVARLMQEGVVRNAVATARRKDGAIRDFEVSVTLIAVDGAVNSHAVWIARDVTDAHSSAAAVRESQSRFALLFEHSPLPMCYASADDNFATTQWNVAWFKSFGFDPVRDQSKSGVALNFWVQPQDRLNLLAMVKERQAYSHSETTVRRADGSIRQVAISTRLFLDTVKPLLVTTYFDITEREESRKKIEVLNTELENRVLTRTAELQTTNLELSQTLETLRLAKDQLVQSEKLAALGALVAGVSHELNTPIGNGLTVASALEHKVEEFVQKLDVGIRRSELQGFLEETRFAAEIITRNLGRAGSLVSSFKQVAVDQTSSQRRVFALSALVSEILLTLNAVIKKHVCVIDVQVPAELVLESYPGPLGQVLTNLINNALVHGLDPGDAGTVSIFAQLLDDGMVHLVVRDTGKGIAADNLHRIFEPFFTTRLGQGGSGLGLHIVHNIVEGVLGGQIKASSVPGQGCEFSMVLPHIAPQLIHD